LPTVPVSEIHAVTHHRAQSLRAAMGVRSPAQAQTISSTGWCLVGGCRIAWEQTSAAAHHCQPVVCLHEAGGGSREFRPLLERIPAGSRLICFDWPGHGRSEELTGASSGAKGRNAKLTVESASAILSSSSWESRIPSCWGMALEPPWLSASPPTIPIWCQD